MALLTRAMLNQDKLNPGRLAEDKELWGEENNLIAISRQIAKYHLPLN